MNKQDPNKLKNRQIQNLYRQKLKEKANRKRENVRLIELVFLMFLFAAIIATLSVYFSGTFIFAAATNPLSI